MTINVGKPTDDQARWLRMRGEYSGGVLRLRVRCWYLGADGRCGIYEHRPHVCREFDVGGKLCRAARAAEKERAGNGKE